MRPSTVTARRRSPIPGAAVAPALLGAAGAAAATVLAIVDPEQGHYPVCPTYALTGIYCPGCGGLRAVHALLHGDVGLALQRNPLVVLAVPLLVWAYLAWVRRRLLGVPLRRLPPAGAGWAAGVVVLIWAVLRNLPAFGWLAP